MKDHFQAWFRFTRHLTYERNRRNRSDRIAHSPIGAALRLANRALGVRFTSHIEAQEYSEKHPRKFHAAIMRECGRIARKQRRENR